MSSIVAHMIWEEQNNMHWNPLDIVQFQSRTKHFDGAVHRDVKLICTFLVLQFSFLCSGRCWPTSRFIGPTTLMPLFPPTRLEHIISISKKLGLRQGRLQHFWQWINASVGWFKQNWFWQNMAIVFLHFLVLPQSLFLSALRNCCQTVVGTTWISSSDEVNTRVRNMCAIFTTMQVLFFNAVVDVVT